MAPWPGPWDHTHSREAEHRLRRLKRGFTVVSRHHDRRATLRRLFSWLKVVIVLAIAGYGIYIQVANYVGWSPMVILRHLQAYKNCDAARAVDLAPAARGEPGYWSHLDADDDGIACEPWHGYHHYRRQW